MTFALLPSIGLPEIFVLFFALLFWATLIGGPILLYRKLSRRNRLDDTVAKLVEENRRLRAEAARARGDSA